MNESSDQRGLSFSANTLLVSGPEAAPGHLVNSPFGSLPLLFGSYSLLTQRAQLYILVPIPMSHLESARRLLLALRLNGTWALSRPTFNPLFCFLLLFLWTPRPRSSVRSLGPRVFGSPVLEHPWAWVSKFFFVKWYSSWLCNIHI